MTADWLLQDVHKVEAAERQARIRRALEVQELRRVRRAERKARAKERGRWPWRHARRVEVPPQRGEGSQERAERSPSKAVG